MRPRVGASIEPLQQPEGGVGLRSDAVTRQSVRPQVLGPLHPTDIHRSWKYICLEIFVGSLPLVVLEYGARYGDITQGKICRIARTHAAHGQTAGIEALH